MQDHDPSARQIPWPRKLLYALVLFAVALVVCEGALRVRATLRYGSASSQLRDAMTVYDAAAGLNVPRPGYEITGNRIHVRINSLGFRGEEVEPEKPVGTIRIVCLGASTTFSTEVSSNDMTWPAILQRKLRQEHPGVRFEVINAAVPGYVSSDNLKNLKHRVLPLKPDLVIYYEANNEIVKDTRELALAEGIVAGSPSRAIATLSRVSLMFDLAYKNLAIARRGTGSSSIRRLDTVPADLPARFIGTLEEMHRELSTRDIRMLLSTFIVKFRRDQDRAVQVRNADVAFFYMPWMSIDGMLNAIDRYNQAIVDYGLRAGIPVVDDREAIPADGDHFADCMHLLDRGSQAMADRFDRFLRTSGLADRLIRRATDRSHRGNASLPIVPVV